MALDAMRYRWSAPTQEAVRTGPEVRQTLEESLAVWQAIDTAVRAELARPPGVVIILCPGLHAGRRRSHPVASPRSQRLATSGLRRARVKDCLEEHREDSGQRGARSLAEAERAYTAVLAAGAKG